MATYTINTNPQPQPTGPGPKSGRKRIILWTAVAVVGLAGCGVGAWAWWSSRAPSPDGDPLAVAKFVASDKFAEMSSTEKQPYLDTMQQDPRKYMEAARSENMTDDQRMAAMRNFMMSRMQEQMDKYFAIAPGPEREQYLDSLIDQMESRRQQWAANGPTSRPAWGGQGGLGGQGGPGGGPGGRGGGMTADRMKNMTENIPPGTRAQFAEFRQAMRERRKARGLPEGRWGR